MRKMIVFFFFHFVLILFIQIYAFADAYFEKKSPLITKVNNVLYSTWGQHYITFTGINTGYGFYGINVATNKFFMIDAFDKNNKVIKTFDLSNFYTKSTHARFNTCASWLYNFNVENEKIKEKTGTKSKLYQLRIKFLNKIYNHIGLYAINDIKKCDHFTIKLVTVVPPDIWNSSLQKNNVYTLQKYDFYNR